MIIELFKHIYFRLPLLIRLLLSIFVIMYIFGVTIHFVEPTEFPTIFDGIWWSFVTGATVGFGDFAPETIPGRIIGILLILSGGGLLTFYITSFSASTVKHEQNLSKGKVAFKGKGHIIFIGWNERTRKLIDLTINKDSKAEIVLIDHTLTKLPYQDNPVHFIHGYPSEDATLKLANIDLAAKVIVSADILKNERQADNHTILTTVALRGNNEEIPIIAEILSKSQVDNALRAGANTVIRSNDFMSVLFYHELFHFKQAKPFEAILHLLSSQQFHHLSLPEELESESFFEAANYYLKKHQLLFGILRNDEWEINPVADFILKEGDVLLTLKSWE